jgi:RND superfamily putative drug exporter
MRRPVVVATATSALLLAIAAPALWIKTGGGGLRQLPPDSAARTGIAHVSAAAGEGAIGPLEVMVTPAEAAPAVADRLAAMRDRIARVPSVDGGSAMVVAQPIEDPEDRSVRQLVDEVPQLAPPGARIDVGGAPAASRDFIELIEGHMWVAALLILGASYLVLLGLLRSVLLPLKAVLMTGLSVLSAYGVLVLVYQYGIGPSWIGATSDEIDAMVPILLMATVFGLSMDYEVFLLSRIRERYDVHGDTERAVVEGLAGTARTITSAAAIMVVVFGAFVLTSVPVTRQIGLGLAVAVALDATIVRLLLVPATMRLLGRWNWWMPRLRRRPEDVPSGDGQPAPAR